MPMLVESGLSTWLGERFVSLPVQVFLVTFVIEWVTCLTSNTATSNIMIPIAAEMANAAQVYPYTISLKPWLAVVSSVCQWQLLQTWWRSFLDTFRCVK